MHDDPLPVASFGGLQEARAADAHQQEGDEDPRPDGGLQRQVGDLLWAGDDHPREKGEVPVRRLAVAVADVGHQQEQTGEEWAQYASHQQP